MSSRSVYTITQPLTAEGLSLLEEIHSRFNEEDFMIKDNSAVFASTAEVEYLLFNENIGGSVDTLTTGTIGTGTSFTNNDSEPHVYSVTAFVSFYGLTGEKHVVIHSDNPVYRDGYVAVNTVPGSATQVVFNTVSALVLLNPGELFAIQKYTPGHATEGVEAHAARLNIFKVS